MYEQCGIRPPSEANSLLLRVARNCPWNQCLFCPNIDRITTYARATTIKRKTAEEMRQLKAAGLSRMHMGLESGSPTVLNRLARFGDRQGFSLVELMIVIAIMCTLAAISTPLLSSYMMRAKRIVAISDIRTIDKEISAFVVSTDRLPDTLAEIGLSGLKDPWGTPYQYLPVEGTPKGKLRKDHFLVPVNTDYDLYSMGPDQDSNAPFTAKASRDDIVRANNGQFVGPVEAY
ncbi:MAG: prepilin-type N-terminal cleavage/methylation domain-containing protein [Pseudomonadota bacterium]